MCAYKVHLYEFCMYKTHNYEFAIKAGFYGGSVSRLLLFMHSTMVWICGSNTITESFLINN